MAINDASTPEPGTDSRVEDWFGQSVNRDSELADRLTDEFGADEAEQKFEQQATGSDEQAARHGEHIDPDQGRSAYGDGGNAQE
jgi:hypothetical protein